MNPASAIALYASIWLVVLFLVLPFGVNTAMTPEKGHASSAPLSPRIAKKMLITSCVSLLVWGIVFALIKAKVYSFAPTGI